MSSFLSLYLNQTPLGLSWTPETEPEGCTSSRCLEAFPAAPAQDCLATRKGLATSAAMHDHNGSSDTSEASCSDNETSEEAAFSQREGGKRMAQYNQSQWTHEEHERFLVALTKYLPSGSRQDPITGKVSVGLGAGVAKQVAAFVGTRTPLQVRSHAQKHFLRQNRRGEKKRL
eukprot:526895-Hanusia_phi.AAC.1